MEKLKTAIVFVVGALVGAGLVQAFHAINDRKRREVFEEKLRCKELVANYVKGRSVGANGDLPANVAVLLVEFSLARNSCVAATSESIELGERAIREFKVVDLVTGGAIFSGECIFRADESYSGESHPCTREKEAELLKAREAAFDHELKSSWLR